MNWGAITAIAAAIAAVVAALLAITGVLSRLAAYLRRGRDQGQGRLFPARSAGAVRRVFLTASDHALGALRSLDVAIATGRFSRPASSDEVARAEDAANRAHKNVALMRKAGTDLHQRFYRQDSRFGSAALQAVSAAQQALDALAPFAVPGPLAADDTLRAVREEARGHLASAEKSIADLLALGPAVVSRSPRRTWMRRLVAVIAAVVTAVAVVALVTRSSVTCTTTIKTSPATGAPRATVEKANCSDRSVSVRGHVSGIPSASGWQLWLVLYAQGANLYYPLWPGRLTVEPNGRFNRSAVAFRSTAIGIYERQVTLVDHAEDHQLHQYLIDVVAKHYPGLSSRPRGAILARVQVIRRR